MPSIKDYISNLKGDKRKLVSILNKHDINASEQETFTELIPKTETITVRENDVNFYDYNGDLVYAYSKDDFLALTSFPANPTHTGLTAQGWNWTFSGAQDYVRKYGYLDIGQNYVTDDGSTRLYIKIENPLQLSVSLSLNIYTSLQVDWGDESAIEDYTGSSGGTMQTITHTYQDFGEYTISLIPNHQETRTISFWVPSSSTNFLGVNSVYSNNSKSGIVRKIELGRGIVEIGRPLSNYTYAFRGLYNLESISVPTDLPHTGAIQSYGFADCSKLKAFVYPLGFISGGDGAASDGSYNFDGCLCLKPIICETQKFVVTGYRTSSTFTRCQNIDRFFYPSENNSRTGVLFSNNSNSPMRLVVLPDELTRIENSAFSNLTNAKFINMLPSSLTYLGSNAFYGNKQIISVTIPSGITALNENTFGYCISLSEVIVEGDITSIGNQVFYNCTSLHKISFLNCTSVPTLGSSVFLSTASNLQILVPEALYSDWIAATNWSTYASQIYPADSEGNILPKP